MNLREILILSFGFISISANAGPLKTHTLIDHEDQGILLKFIVEDPSLRDNQSLISQWKVGSQFVPLTDENKVPEIISAWWASHAGATTRLSVHEEGMSDSTAPLPMPSGRALWVATKSEWTEEDEENYSAWIQKNTGENFAQGSGLLADCADMGLLFRWVYARNNKLPIANSMGGSGKLFGNFSGSSTWDKLPSDNDWKKDERFKAAMRYLFDQTYTGSIIDDLYPTVINSTYVRPGTMYMIIRAQSGHTQTLYQVDDSGITTEWGNEPSAETIYTTRVIIEYENSRGFLSWRHVKSVNEGGQIRYVLIPGVQMPGYSREQFAQKFTDGSVYRDWIYYKLGLAIGYKNELQNLIDAFKTHLDIRMKLTIASIPVCVIKKCDPTSVEYNNGSTPGRDRSIREVQSDFLKLIKSPKLTTADVDGAIKTLEEMGEILKGTGLTYKNLLMDPDRMKLLSSDPRVSFNERWGFKADAGSPSLNFMILSNAVTELLTERVAKIYLGNYYCAQRPCSDADKKDYDTTDIDAELRAIFPYLTKSIRLDQLDPAVQKNIAGTYSSIELQYTNRLAPECAEPGKNICSLRRVIWDQGGSDRIQHFSSNPTDTIEKRWGYVQ